MEKIFKKTIQFNIIALIALIISAFNEPYEVNQINETISSGIIDNEGSIGLLFGIIVVVYFAVMMIPIIFGMYLACIPSL